MTRKKESGGVFLNYRRSESGSFAGRIFDRLNMAYPDQVFIDTEAIRVSEDFVEKIETEIRSCKVVLAVIGKDWADSLAQSRESGNDYVAMELAIAIEQDKPIIPILLDGTRMPAEESLPEELRLLARKNAIEMSHTRFERDIDELIHTLSFLLGKNPLQETSSWPIGAKRAWLIVTAVIPVVAFLSAENHWMILMTSFLLIPMLTSAVALRWPIKKHWAAAFVVVMHAFIIIIPLIILANTALMIGVNYAYLAAILCVVIANVILVMWICSRFYRV